MTRVLLVDDKEDNVYYLSTLLRSQGYDIESARDGADALTRARAIPPDVVVSDLLMPIMDGYTLLRHWKADDRLKAAPFIVYTATYTDPEDEQLAISLGADAFILKPSEPDDFLARFRAVVDGATAVVPALPQLDPVDSPLQQYNETLIRKLEKKSVELEQANRALQLDIAGRALAETALRESEASFRLLTEIIPQLVWITRSDGWNIFFNRRWFEYTGFSSVETSGHGWTKPFHPEDRERAESAWTAAIASGSDYSVEVRIRRSDDVYRWWLVRGLPLRDASGMITKWFGTCTDIDDLKRASALLERTQEELRHAHKMEAIGRLAGGIAHDFNNLLSVILSYTALILDELTPEMPMRADVLEVHRAGERATDLTKQLLAFSRQQVLQPRVLDLRQVVGQMQRMLPRLLGEDVELSISVGRPAHMVHADPTQIEQIVMNLAVNARDAMPDGGKLTIEVSNVEIDEGCQLNHVDMPRGTYVMLAMSDSGTGMDAATRERIFEPFFTTKPMGKGTGLGLATVFGIVKQSRGHIFVYSEIGIGTTFKIYLPCTERPTVTSTSVVPPPLTLRGTETILLVEDDEQVRSMNCAILRRNGYTVLVAENGIEALRIAHDFAESIDLLLTDVVMPRMSGRQLVERLGVARPATKVLYISGYTDDAIVHHGVLDAGIAFLQKPITPQTLLRKVREVLMSFA